MRICFSVEGCFPVGEFYLRAVLSDNYSDRVVFLSGEFRNF